MQQIETQIKTFFSISQYNEYYLPSVNRAVFEKIDSKSLFDKKFRDDFKREGVLHIIIGLDSGLLANYVMSRPLAKDSKFIFVELDSVLCLLNIDVEADKVDEISIGNFDTFTQLLQDERVRTFFTKKQVRVHRSTAAAGDYLEEYNYLVSNVEKAVDEAIFEERVGFSQKIFFKEQLRNIAENHTPASILKGLFCDKTCIVIAGGPSLDETIGWIKENQASLIIFAVSRVVGKLYAEGIIPHIIVSVDPEDFSFEVNRGMMGLADQSLFINSYHVSSRLLAQWQGKSLYMGSRFPWGQVNDANNIQTLGPTVTNATVHLAMEIGFKSILLTGADFCFSKSGYTHAKGSLETAVGPNLGFITELVETYSGDLAESVVQLQMAAKSLAEDIAVHDFVKVTNLSNNAVKVDGVGYSHYSKVKLTASNMSPADLLDLLPEQSSTAFRRSSIDIALDEVNDAILAFKAIKTLSSKALDTIMQIDSSDSCSDEILRLSSILDDIELSLNQDYKNFSQLIKFYGYAEFSEFLTTKKISDWDQEHINAMSKKYYQAFHNIAVELDSLCENAQERLHSRCLELSDKDELSVVSKQWREDRQPGRVFIWKALHYDRMSNEIGKNNDLIAELEEEYGIQCECEPEIYKEVLDEQSCFNSILHKIIHFLHINNVRGLNYLSTNLKLLAEKDDDANTLYWYALSGERLLDKDYRQALDALLELDDANKCESMWKLQLKLSLILADLDLAASALASVLQFSDQYMPQYAHILRLQGNNQHAVNVYLDYLDKYPGDIPTWFKLGQFMIEVNEVETALNVFDKILEIDNNNEMAKMYIQGIQDAFKSNKK